MEFYHNKTGFLIADTSRNPLGGNIPLHSDVLNEAEQLILSASGWRKIFAEDGDEESGTRQISAAGNIIAGIMALSYSTYIKKNIGSSTPKIVLGIDTRPTGPAILDIFCRIFIAEGFEIENLFIAAAPEIMAYSAVNSEIDGFAYISASHNPAGHNGVKFGRNGGVIGSGGSVSLINLFRNFLDDPDIPEKIAAKISAADLHVYEKILGDTDKNKQKALDAYFSFSKEIISDSKDPEEQEKFFGILKTESASAPTGVIGELNGSARTLSIDRQILSASGTKILTFNDVPGRIVHRIVPEGKSLDECRNILEKQYAGDSSFIIGYVPDNDGDRGNIVYINTRTGKAEILQAQEVFALSVLGELAFTYVRNTTGGRKTKTAVAVNGPTSMRIDRIARFFGADVFRAEVGEANVVNLAEKLRKDGYTVRILGEGSNGGNITHPAKVRDPVNTLYAILKLLLYKDSSSGKNLFKLWCELSGSEDKYRDKFSLQDIIDTLPKFVTTSAYEKQAVMKIETKDHRILKERYESVFLKEWDKKREYLGKRFGITNWKEINYEGTEAKTGTGSEFRTGRATGGLKIIFTDSKGRETDYIWMRGSGTEPVFRVLADCEGEDTEREKWLLNWHREMIKQADKGGNE